MYFLAYASMIKSIQSGNGRVFAYLLILNTIVTKKTANVGAILDGFQFIYRHSAPRIISLNVEIVLSTRIL